MLDIKNVGFLGSLNANQSISYVTGGEMVSNTGESYLSIPASRFPLAQAGDLILIYYITFDDDNEELASAPSGMTNILTGNYEVAWQYFHGYSYMYKILTTSDITNGITLQGATSGTIDELSAMYRIFRPTKPITSVTAKTSYSTTGVNHTNTATAPTNQVINPVGETSPVIVCAIGRSVANTTAIPNSPNMDISPSFQTIGWSGGTTHSKIDNRYHIYNSSPQSHTVSATDVGYNMLSSFYLLITG